MARDYFNADSSFIESCGYDDQTQTLGIRFKSGETWNYTKVEADTWAALKKAHSTGQYFHSYIKGKYNATKVQ